MERKKFIISKSKVFKNKRKIFSFSFYRNAIRGKSFLFAHKTIFPWVLENSQQKLHKVRHGKSLLEHIFHLVFIFLIWFFATHSGKTIKWWKMFDIFIGFY